MGVSKFDRAKAHRNLEDQYGDLNGSFGSEETVDKLMGDYVKISMRRFEKGDIAACDIKMDIDQALEEAFMTPKQRLYVQKYYIEQHTEEEIADLYGITQQTVNKTIQRGVKHLADFFAKWDEYTGRTLQGRDIA